MKTSPLIKIRHIAASLIILLASTAIVRSQTVNVTQSRRHYDILGILNGGFLGTPPPPRSADSLTFGPVSLGDFGTHYDETSIGGAPGFVGIRADIESNLTLTGSSIAASALLDTISTSMFGTAPSEGRVFFSWFVRFTLPSDYNYSFTGATALDDLDFPNRSTVFLNRNDPSAAQVLILQTDSLHPGNKSGSFSGVLPAGDYTLAAEIGGFGRSEAAGVTDVTNADLSFTFTASPVPEPGSCTLLLIGLGVLGHGRRMENRKNEQPASPFAVSLIFS